MKMGSFYRDASFAYFSDKVKSGAYRNLAWNIVNFPPVPESPAIDWEFV